MLEVPFKADAYKTGNSNCSKEAPNSMNKSITSSTTFSGLADGLSILLTTTIGVTPAAKAFFKTNLVWGIVPS